jgi:hypothetical protein
MTAVFVLLAIAWFGLAIWTRISTLVGNKGLVHQATRLTKQSVAYRKRLERDLHSHS